MLRRMLKSKIFDVIMNKIKIYNPKWFVIWLSVIALSTIGICWMIVSMGGGVLHVAAVGFVAFLLHAYIAVWGAVQPLEKKCNRKVFWYFLLFLAAFICWFFWLCFDDVSFDSRGMHVQVNRYDHIDPSYLSMLFILPIYGIVFYFYGLYIFYMFRRPLYGLSARASKKSDGGASIMGTIGGVMLMDKFLHGKKKHDHKLGSYWADHDDDGNYDPGAWRRKYDR